MKKGTCLIFILLGCIYGCDEIFYVEDISKESILLNAPSNNISVEEGDISFHWNKVAEADSYQLQIATPNFTSTNKMELDTLITTNKFIQTLDFKNYHWRVKALNSSYETSYTSYALKVTEMERFSDRKVILESPKNDLYSNKVSHVLQWESLDNAVEYRLQVWKPNSEGIKIKDTITEVLKKEVQLVEGSYLWQVSAMNGTEITAYTSRMLSIDKTSPGKPGLNTPENDSVFKIDTLKFTWNRKAIEGAVEFDSLYVFTDESLTSLKFKEKSTSKDIKKTLEKGLYYWFVRAFDSAGNKSEQSDVFKVTLE